MSRVDARLLEMQFLAQLDRDGPRMYQEPYTITPEQQMIFSLARDGYINDGSDPSTDDGVWTTRKMQSEKGVKLTIGHKGRVRLSELQQQLKTGRDRDPTGLCVARRHLEIDLAIAILAVSQGQPLTIAYLDMNDLKLINDTYRHAAGDAAIRAYLEAVVATFGKYGDAYRGEGGDEVVVILPSVSSEETDKLLNLFVRQLGKEAVLLGDAKVEKRLTASCGSVSTTSPAEDAEVLLDRADKVQSRAKKKSKELTPRVSAIAVGDDNDDVTTYMPGVV
ncbi:GGDEF domain-containing protein [Sorangium sp. So ce327]|uniref:GGDEF domain-containing protein n=1 Tax=Sorangium sp. So ce327 TaxID=3133301 RepID=UPI003F63EDBE